MATFIDQEHTA